MRELWTLRQLPWWMHGGEVLHRAPDGRARPRVRRGIRRTGAVPRTRQAQVQRRPLTKWPGHAEASDQASGPAVQRKSGVGMARDTWFETVAFAQERAKKRLP